MRRAYPGYLKPLPDLPALIKELNAIPTVQGALEALARAYTEAIAGDRFSAMSVETGAP
jgi:hypothetical protein